METTTRRLVNVYVVRRMVTFWGREYLDGSSGGAWGVPEDALAYATAAGHPAIRIVDVRTKEEWVVPTAA